MKRNQTQGTKNSLSEPDNDLLITGCKLDRVLESAEAFGLLPEVRDTLVSARDAAWDVFFTQCYLNKLESWA